jgi:ferredoxin
MKRSIIKIDEAKCTGCGVCIPNCPDGALRVIDGKARVVSDLFCDGLGACIGHCPEGALTFEEREAEEYDERRVMENVVRGGENVIRAHLAHLRDHGQGAYLLEALAYLKEHTIDIPGDEKAPSAGGPKGPEPCGCPGARVMDFGKGAGAAPGKGPAAQSRLGQWPVQVHLVPPSAPFLNGADLLVAADCVPFAFADFHDELLAGKALLVGCPKLDDTKAYREKFEEIFRRNKIKSVTVARMEVPCCFGLVHLVREAMKAAGAEIPLHEVVISLRGERK